MWRRWTVSTALWVPHLANASLLLGHLQCLWPALLPSWILGVTVPELSLQNILTALILGDRKDPAAKRTPCPLYCHRAFCLTQGRGAILKNIYYTGLAQVIRRAP